MKRDDCVALLRVAKAAEAVDAVYNEYYTRPEMDEDELARRLDGGILDRLAEALKGVRHLLST